MKISDNFIVKKIMDDYIVVPVGNELVDFNALITINETSAFLWENMKTETTVSELCDKLCAEYSVDRETALADIKEFVGKLRVAGILKDE